MRGTRFQAFPSPTALTLCALALVLTAWALRGVAPSFGRPLACSSEYMDGGEELLHGVRPSHPQVSARLPLSSVLATLLSAHWQLSEGDYRLACVVAATGLLFALGGLVGSPAAVTGALAVLLRAVCPPSPDFSYPEPILSLLILTSAVFLVWRARAPSRTKTLWLALSLGVTLLFRSTLAIFPLLPALQSILSGSRHDWRRRWTDAAILVGVPFLMLTPWVWLNWAAFGRIQPFEMGAYDTMAAGALGLIESVEVPMTRLMQNSSSQELPLSVLGWFVGEIAQNPLRYAGAFASRVAYAFGASPVLALLAVVGFWTGRRDPAVRALALLAGYLLAVHCLMAVLHRFFAPLWPLLAALAASGLARYWAPGPGREKSAPAPWLVRPIQSWLGVLMTLCLFTLWRVGVYALTLTGDRAQQESLLNKVLSRRPHDVWGWRQRGRLHLEAGRVQEASEDFARALTLSGYSPELDLNLAWTQALRGAPERLLRWRPRAGDAQPPAYILRFKTEILRAHVLSGLGRTQEALRALANARQTFVNDMSLIPDASAAVLRERISVDDGPFLGEAFRLLDYRPEREQLALVRTMTELLPGSATLWTERACLSLRLGASLPHSTQAPPPTQTSQTLGPHRRRLLGFQPPCTRELLRSIRRKDRAASD